MLIVLSLCVISRLQVRTWCSRFSVVSRNVRLCLHGRSGISYWRRECVMRDPYPASAQSTEYYAKPLIIQCFWLIQQTVRIQGRCLRGLSSSRRSIFNSPRYLYSIPRSITPTCTPPPPQRTTPSGTLTYTRSSSKQRRAITYPPPPLLRTRRISPGFPKRFPQPQ